MKRILTDFNLPRWKNTNMSLVVNLIEKFNNKTLLGELEHPINPREDHIIHEDNVAVEITNISLENNICYGDVKCLDNEKGLQARNMFDNGGRLSIRASATGNVASGIKFTNIKTWDVVK